MRQCSAFVALLVVLVVNALLPAAAAACAVCYGDVDSGLTRGMNNGILVLLGVIAAVQGGFLALFLTIRRRARQVDRRKESYHLIQGGAG